MSAEDELDANAKVFLREVLDVIVEECLGRLDIDPVLASLLAGKGDSEPGSGYVKDIYIESDCDTGFWPANSEDGPFAEGTDYGRERHYQGMRDIPRPMRLFLDDYCLHEREWLKVLGEQGYVTGNATLAETLAASPEALAFMLGANDRRARANYNTDEKNLALSEEIVPGYGEEYEAGRLFGDRVTVYKYDGDHKGIFGKDRVRPRVQRERIHLCLVINEGAKLPLVMAECRIEAYGGGIGSVNKNWEVRITPNREDTPADVARKIIDKMAPCLTSAPSAGPSPS